MKNLQILKYTTIIVFLLAVTACATSPWNQEQADSHLNIGIAYLGSERTTDALKEFLQAEKLAPRDPKVHYHIGMSYYKKGLNDKAINEFKRALSLSSDYSEAHNFLGRIYLETGLWDNAIESFKNALSNILYETPDKALFNMGMAYYGKKDYQKALDAYQNAKSRRPTTVPHPLIDLHMGITWYAQGNFEKAVPFFKESLKTAPSLLESRYWLGQSYTNLHDVEKARAEFKAIIGITPESEMGIAARKALDSLR